MPKVVLIILSLLISSAYCINNEVKVDDSCLNNNTCLKFSQFYKKYPTLKKSYLASLKLASINKNDVPNDLETPMLPIKINGVIYYMGSACQEHLCGDHYIQTLNSIITNKVVGVYYQLDNKNPIWIGSPSNNQKNILLNPNYNN